MDRVADGCCDDLGLIAVDVKNLRNRTHEFDPRLADIIKSSKERRYIRCPCLCRKQCLVCGKDQCDVGLDPLCGERFHCL